MKFRYLFIPALLVVGILSWQSPTRTLTPQPTEHRLDPDTERQNASERRAWFEEMHRTGPDVDWREVERANGRELQQLRNETAGRDGHDSRWVEVGSRNQAGRMHAAAFSTAGDSLYGGTSHGGVWKGSPDGEGWRPLGDNLWGGSHGLAIAGTEAEVITAITDGGGLHYSEDSGTTWIEPTGIVRALNQCKRVTSDAGDADRVLLLARDSSGASLYLSGDAGRSYQEVRRLNTSFGDFWLDRRVGGAVYLLDGNHLYFSSGSLQDWTDLGTLPYGYTNSVVLTASEAGAPTIYAAARVNSQWRLYRSADAGATWEYRFQINDFWETLCASITDADLVAFAGVELWRSTDGAGSFNKVNNWWDYYDDPVHKLHADFPGLECLPTDGGREVWYAATDGGLFRSDDGLASVTNISLTGLGVSQYYSTLTSVNDPDLLLAGAQDQGYQRSTGPVRGPGWDFEQLISGDYGHLTSSDGSHDVVYSVYPGFVLVQQGESSPALAGFLDFPAEESHGWLPFIVADPDDPFAFYFCGTRLQRGTWRGGDSVTYSASIQLFTEAGGNYLTAFGIAPSNHQQRIAVVDNGRIWNTPVGGNPWRLSTDLGPSAHYFYGTAIAYHSNDADRAWIGGSGYSGPGVWRTEDGGDTWEGAGTGLPRTLVYGLAIESATSDAIYAATESGPYRLDPDTDQWYYIGGSTAPLTTYWSVEAVPAAQVVRFGTYGRGIWDYSTDVTTPAQMATVPGANLELVCAPNPFNPRTTIAFRLEDAGRATVTIHDVAGRRVALLRDEHLAAGRHEIAWQGRDDGGQACSSGVYLVRVATEAGSASQSIVLVR